MNPPRSPSLLAQWPARRLVPYALLAAITLLAFGLRFYKLGVWSFWTDELFTLNRVEAHYASLATSLQTVAATKWAALSLILMGPVLTALGQGEWPARLIPALIGSVTVPIFYLPIKRLYGPAVALLAALLLALSPWHIFWSQNARFYTSLMLFTFLALVAFFFGLEQGRLRWLLFAVSFLYLALSERLLAFLAVPVALAYFLVLKFNWRVPRLKLNVKVLLPLALLALVIVAAALPGVPELIATFGGNTNHDPVRLLLAIGYRLGLPVIGLGLAAGLYLARRQRATMFMLLGATVPIAALVILSSVAFTVDRYVFAFLPFWLVLAALALKHLLTHPTSRARLIGGGLLALTLGGLVIEDAAYFEYQGGQRPNWKAALQFVAEHKLASDLVAPTSPEAGYFYLNQGVLWINDVEPQTMADRRIWFLIDDGIGGVDPALNQWILAESTFVEEFAVRIPGKSLDIRIYLYQPAPEDTVELGQH